MKKLLVLTLCLFTLQFTVRAGDDKPINVNELPAKARQFLKAYFPESKVSYAKMDSDWVSKSYDVVFANGDKVEFDKNGQWKEVDCKSGEVPGPIVPQAIRTYVSRNHSDQKILKIDRDTKDYEVKLGNGLELKFDTKFRPIGIDD